MNIRTKFIWIVILSLLLLNCQLSFVAYGEEKKSEINQQKIKEVLKLTDAMNVIITEINYRKEPIPLEDEGKKIGISNEQLRQLLLEEAVVVNGVQINYWFDYETVYINGLIIDRSDKYRFSYNLGGFGYIFLGNNKIIEFGDMSKTVPEDRGE